MKSLLPRLVFTSTLLAMSLPGGATTPEEPEGVHPVSDTPAAQAAIAVPELAGSADFPDKNLRRWSRRDFSGMTRYELVDDAGVRVLRGSTMGDATLLYREKDIDLSRTPWIEWSWRVNTVFSGLDERSRSGDDYPARLYVVARTGFLPWETLAINYVWSSGTPIDTLWRNPFTDKAAMIAVQSGASKVGEWTTQKRNIAQDFERAFGKKINKINGFAVMVDGDNSGSSATAWFGNIDFSAR